MRCVAARMPPLCCVALHFEFPAVLVSRFPRLKVDSKSLEIFRRSMSCLDFSLQAGTNRTGARLKDGKLTLQGDDSLNGICGTPEMT